jgi:hypothetical protein
MDALMSAFAMFSLKAPSLLAFDKERAEGNLHTIYGIERVPCDLNVARKLRQSFGLVKKQSVTGAIQGRVPVGCG